MVFALDGRKSSGTVLDSSSERRSSEASQSLEISRIAQGALESERSFGSGEGFTFAIPLQDQMDEVQGFKKQLEGVSYAWDVEGKIACSSLTKDQKVSLAAAFLCKFGTKELFRCARAYGLSIEEQKKARMLAGAGLIENTVSWVPTSKDEKLEKRLKEISSSEITFASFTNRVGGYKSRTTVSFNDKTYVVTTANREYVKRWEAQKQREHRPDYLFFPVEGEEGTFPFLSEFKGSQIVDYANPKHLDLVIDLALNFSDSHQMDFNLGNILIQEDEIFYIDKDLDYCKGSKEHPKLANLDQMVQNIYECLHTKEERAQSVEYVKNRIRSKNQGDCEPMLAAIDAAVVSMPAALGEVSKALVVTKDVELASEIKEGKDPEKEIRRLRYEELEAQEVLSEEESNEYLALANEF